MKTRIGIRVVVFVAILSSPVFQPRGQAVEGDSLLGEIRALMADRDLDAAKAKLEEAAKVEGTGAFAKERERLQLIYEYLEAFWTAVDNGAKSLQVTDEMKIGDLRVNVVEYQPGELVLRVEGRNVRYTVKTLNPAVAVAMAERIAKPDVPENKVYFGVFQMMDGKGDRKKARRLFDEAQKANVDVAALLPELDVTPVVSLPVEIPQMTALMRKQLAPASWSLRRQSGDRTVRQPLKGIAEQAATGYLEVTAPSDAGETQLVYSRKIMGNFLCTLILQNVDEGQVFGLFAADSLGAGYQLPLPKGSVMVQFLRQAGEFKARLNKKDVSVEARGEVTPNMPGMIGITLPPGSKCVVAWVEFQAR